MKFKKPTKTFPLKTRVRKIACWLILFLCSQGVWAEPKDFFQNFNIDAGQADVSLIEFAKQADLTIIFPYEKVQSRWAIL